MRYIIVRDGNGVVIAKEVYSGDTTYIVLKPNSTEVDQATFDSTPFTPDPVPTRNDATSALLTGIDGYDKLTRAILLTLLDEINILRKRDRDRAVDVAASTSLSDLKTRWAAESTLDDRTVSQGKTAVQSKLSSGASD